MKINLVIGGVGKPGGAERVMCTLANALSALDHDVSLFVLVTDEKPYYHLDPKVKYITAGNVINIPGVRYYQKLARMKRYIRYSNPDVIISFITPFNCAVLKLVKNMGIPVIVSERTSPTYYEGTKVEKECNRLYPYASAIVCQTQEIMDCFADKSYYEKCRVIYNPLLMEIDEKKSYKSKGGFCAVGRLTEEKNYPLMLRAFKSFSSQRDKFYLDIYGIGALYDELSALIKELRMEDRVFLKGSVENINRIYKQYDAFIMTSNVEGMPNALAEAMASGLPCVCTDCIGGGAAALIKDGVNGFLVGREDENALVDRITALTDDENLRKRIGEDAKKIQERLSAETIVKAWLKVIEDCKKEGMIYEL